MNPYNFFILKKKIEKILDKIKKKNFIKSTNMLFKKNIKNKNYPTLHII
jgi:uncharacterized protein YlbG (UPF0298 family)